MRSIFRYPGGKSKKGICEWILSHRPAGVKEYREPFVGGGGIFFAIEQVESCWINDINKGLMAVYMALRDRPDEFIAKCRSVQPAQEGEELGEPGVRGGQPVNKRLEDLFSRLAFDDGFEDQAFRYFFVNRTVFGGRVNYDIESRLYFSNPEGWNIVSTRRLDDAAGRMVGARITCGDYECLFTEPGEDVWIYADPPYVVNTDLSASSQLYQHNFTDDDHRRLASVVKKCHHKVAISYDDNEFIRSLYPESDGFWIYENEWKYSFTTNEGKEDGKELLICNYQAHSEVITATSLEPTELTSEEEDRLEELESYLHKFFLSFIEAGQTLALINEERLYRPYGTFENYCMSKWGIGRDYAYKIIRSSKLASQMYTSVYTRPANEKQLRHLTKLPSTDQAIVVWNRVVEKCRASNEPITEKRVREEVMAEIGQSPKPSPPFAETLRRKWPSLSGKERDTIKEFVNAN